MRTDIQHYKGFTFYMDYLPCGQIFLVYSEPGSIRFQMEALAEFPNYSLNG